MKLSLLGEYVTAYKAGLDFYGDPKGKAKGTEDKSFLVGGEKDRNRYAEKMTNAGTGEKKKKKGKKK